MGGQTWQHDPAPATALPSSTSPTSIYPLTHRGRWAWQGLELSLVGGLIVLFPVVPLECVDAP